MNIQTAHSNRPSAREAAGELKAGLQALVPKMVLFFSSSTYPPEDVAGEMTAAFPGAAVFGCTTAGEIISGQMLKNSIVAMAFNAGVIKDVQVEVLAHVHGQAAAGVPRVFADFKKHYGTAMGEADPHQYFGIILVDGLSGAEEALMEKLGELTDVTFIGASAGDDLKFQRTYVFANGRAYTNAALLVLVKAASGFDFIKTQSFRALDKTLIPTKVNAERREVLEFDHRPAAVAYAEAVGTTVDKLPDIFMSNPVGLMAGDEPYVRSPQRVEGDSVFFYCAVDENAKLQVLTPRDIVEDTRTALTDELSHVKHIQGIVNFHCILRTLELEKKNEMKAYGQLFTDIPTIGFSTYGEEYKRHINQTSTMLVFT